MKIRIALVIALLSILGQLNAQLYQASGGSLLNDGNPTYFSMNVSGLSEDTVNAVFGLESVIIKLTHAYDGELDIKLIAPDGMVIILSHTNGGSGNNYYTTTFNDFATQIITGGTPPYNGSYRPQQALGGVNNNQPGNGVWQLFINDLVPNNNNTGYLASWSLKFGYNTGPTFHFYSSNLPIVVINTHGQSIPDDPKIPVDFNIIDNGPDQRNFLTDNPAFKGTVGIEVRGSSSQSFPKKSYGFENWDVFGQSVDTSFLGMPSESDWILNANYTDKTLLRNVMAYQSFENMDHYATRYRFVEVVINGQYQGVYIFSEKIKRDKNRVDISKLLPEDISGDELTGGYILKIDKSTGSGGAGWVSPFPPPVNPQNQYIYIQYEYPKSDEIVPQQKAYIQDYVTDFETALEGPHFADTAIGFRKYADELSFIDYFLVNEISKNVDGYRLSTYFHKEKDSKGGKIRMGPVWDYDIAWHNANYCNGEFYTGWAYQFPCSDDYWQVPFWWSRLLQDPLYASHLKCRWLQLRSTKLSDDYMMGYIDSLAYKIDEAQFRNFITWPIIGTYVWPNPWPYPESYAEEISVLKTWLLNRLEWIDESLPGTCYTIGGVDGTAIKQDVDIYPNPCSANLTVGLQQNEAGKMKIEIMSQSGAILISLEGVNQAAGYYTNQLNVSSLSPGVYLLRLTMNGTVINRKIVKV